MFWSLIHIILTFPQKFNQAIIGNLQLWYLYRKSRRAHSVTWFWFYFFISRWCISTNMPILFNKNAVFCLFWSTDCTHAPRPHWMVDKRLLTHKILVKVEQFKILFWVEIFPASSLLWWVPPLSGKHTSWAVRISSQPPHFLLESNFCFNQQNAASIST